MQFVCICQCGLLLYTFVKHNHLGLEIFAPIGMLYNVLPINQYTGNITIKCHSKSMGDNRDPTVVLHQEISTLHVSIAPDTRMLLDISNSREYARVLLNIVAYNFLLKLYKCRSCS